MWRLTAGVVLLVSVLSELSPAGEVVTIAGTGRAEYTGDGGPAVEAGVGGPFGIAIGPDGALYICETTNHVIRRWDSKTARLSTVAGSGKKGYAGDGGPALKRSSTNLTKSASTNRGICSSSRCRTISSGGSMPRLA